MGTFKWKYKKSHQKTTMTNIHRRVISFLKERRVHLEVERSFNPYFVDIFLPEYNVAVECDGGKWHNYPYGSERDRKRDRYIISKYKVTAVYRIWGCDINNEYKLNLILDGILENNLIDYLGVDEQIILNYNDKNFKGYIQKVNKLSYVAYIPTLKIKVNVDLNGLVKINNKWYRVIKFNKINSIPLWCKSITNLLAIALKNKTIKECQELIYKVKRLLGTEI